MHSLKIDKTEMHKAFIAMLVGLFFISAASFVDANTNSSQNECKKPKPLITKTTSKSHLKPSEPELENIYIDCGAMTVTQSPIISSNGEKEKEKEKEKEADFTIKIIEAIAKLLSSIAWPIAATAIALFYRREIAKLLARLKRFKSGESEMEFTDADFREGVQNAEEMAEDKVQHEKVTASAVEEASSHPRGTILTAWLEVEDAVQRLDKAKGLLKNKEYKTHSIIPIIHEIQKRDLLDKTYIGLFHELRILRNNAAHQKEFNPSPENAIRYVQLTKSLVAAINKIIDDEY